MYYACTLDGSYFQENAKFEWTWSLQKFPAFPPGNKTSLDYYADLFHIYDYLYHVIFTLSSAGKWFSPPDTGPRPSPSSAFSFTAINNHQAVLFGGLHPGYRKVNDCYFIDFESMVCKEKFMTNT